MYNRNLKSFLNKYVAKGWPLLVIEGSDVCNSLLDAKKQKNGNVRFSEKIINYSKLYSLRNNSEDVAQMVRIGLSTGYY